MGDLVEGGSRGAAGAVGRKMVNVLFRSFNPAYSREQARKIRYIQRKYVQAYGLNSGDDYNKVISEQDEHSKLKMSPRGYHPANPFPDERAYEEALQLNTAPRRGYQGRFAASHAHAAISRIIEYQSKRKARHYIPGVSGHGKANDYINMFLEELKAWCRNQLSLDVVNEEELSRRAKYFQLLKHDNYFWCFPKDANHHEQKIHDVIDYVHNRVTDALEIVQLESKNKSLHSLFKELNDHTTNAFQFGERFLAYLMYAEKKAGADLMNSPQLNGATYETGKLLKILEKSTASVDRAHVIGEDGKSQFQALENDGSLEEKGGDAPNRQGAYDITILRETSMGSSTYMVSIIDPKGKDWVIKKKYAEFEKLALELKDICTANRVVMPDKKKMTKLKLSEAEHEARTQKLQAFLSDLLNVLHKFPSELKKACLSDFMEVADLEEPLMCVVPAESQQNMFKAMQEEFEALTQAPLTKEAREKNKELLEMKNTWGAETFRQLLEAHALLQRMATILGWTLEISHFFVSMFGNTLAFSKLPLKDVLSTQKSIMGRFLVISENLYQKACEVNAAKDYKWHKNLNFAEQYQKSAAHHLEGGIKVISDIETEHLDYEAQVKRLKEVVDRFGPLLRRLDQSIPQIQNELDLPRSEPTGDGLPGGAAKLLSDPMMGNMLALPTSSDAKGTPSLLALEAGAVDYSAGPKIEEIDDEDEKKPSQDLSAKRNNSYKLEEMESSPSYASSMDRGFTDDLNKEEEKVEIDTSDIRVESSDPGDVDQKKDRAQSKVCIIS